VKKDPTSAVDSTRYINTATVRAGTNEVDHISEDVLNSLDRQMKTGAGLISNRLSVMV
jgi:hypothetical protein